MANYLSTTIEQSRRLLSMGLDPATADMVWMSDKWLYSIKDNILGIEDFRETDTLSWSLSALLEVMPKGDAQQFMLCVEVMSHDYVATYSCPVGGHKEISEDPIEAMVELICWMLKKNHIKKVG